MHGAQRARAARGCDLADVFVKRGELLLDEVDRRLILDLELIVELVLRQADENLGPREHMCFEKHHHLPPLILHPRSTKRPTGRRLNRNWFVFEGLILEP
jgi:hypothetical protein